MDINISEANQFINLHAHPQKVNSNDSDLINSWISKYPYCQTLHILATQASKSGEEAESCLSKAATFASNREVLFQFTVRPEDFDSEPVFLDHSLNTTNEIAEPQNDMGQAFGANLNYYKVDEAVAEENTEKLTVAEEDIPTEESIQETENIEEAESQENVEDISDEETQTEEPASETENTEEEKSVEDISDEEEIQTEEPAPETENTEEEKSVEDISDEEEIQAEEPAPEIVSTKETVSQEDVEGISDEEEIQIEEPASETENTEETLSHESVEDISEEETQTEEPASETENTEETVSQEDVEDISDEEETQTEESAPETENTEETLSQESVEDISEEEIQTEEPAPATENTEEEKSVEDISEEEIQAEEPAPETENTEEEKSVEDISEEEIQTEEPAPETQNTEEEESVEEISEEETHTEEPAQETENIEEAVNEENIGNISDAEKETHTEESAPNTEKAVEEENKRMLNKEDELVFESPIATDFFAFAKVEKPSSAPPLQNLPEQKAEEKTPVNTKEEVSQYNDETLPYTFLWWLNKTRKEHATNTQPYVKFSEPRPAKQVTRTDQSLNHQIAENIFHLRGAEEIASTQPKNQTVPFDFRRKEFNIIDKFIKEEPQIKPPAANKIDSENKAKKSSEDANQVVSETLAKIYVEQMLYHKALDVYKKLSLKYPEKSTYFASQIKYLELKVN